MAKIGMPEEARIFSWSMISVHSLGSPGPFESMIPSKLWSMTYWAGVSAGRTVIWQPLLASSLAILRLAPKS